MPSHNHSAIPIAGLLAVRPFDTIGDAKDRDVFTPLSLVETPIDSSGGPP